MDGLFVSRGAGNGASRGEGLALAEFFFLGLGFRV